MVKNITNKSVCIIRSNPVNPDSRVEKEALSLQKAGYDVCILAWDRDSTQREIKTHIKISDTKIPITRLGHKATYGEGFKNIKPYLAFQLHMRKWLRERSFDIIHACDFDTAFFSCGIAKSKKEKFVFDIFDFLFDRPRNFMQKCIKAAQYKLINSADATIICTEERKEQIIGSKPKRLAIIHNTPSLTQVKNGSIKLSNYGKINIVYVGILQDYRLLKEIAEAISELKDVNLHIGGFGKYEKYFLNMSLKFDNIHFYGRLTYADTLALEKKCDVMLAVYDPTISNHLYAAPNKFYESLMLGKPVIMVKGTGMSKIVEDNDIGVLIDYSKTGFIEGIKKLIIKKGDWGSMGVRMKRLYQSQYSWAEMENRLVSLYSELVNEKNTNC